MLPLRITIILLTIAFLSLADTAFIAPVISSHAGGLGASGLQAGLITGIYSLVAIPATPFMGFLLDRAGRRRIIPWLFLGDALAIYSYSLARSPEQLLLARAAHALFDSGVFPASMAMFRDALSGRRPGLRWGFYWLFVTLSIIVGSSTASAIVLRLGFAAVYQLIAILMLAGLAASLAVPELASPPRRGERISFSLLRGRWAGLAPAYLAAFTLYLSLGAVVGSLSTHLRILEDYSERASAAATGIYMALASAVAIFANLVAGALMDRKGARAPLVLGLLAVSASMAVLSAGVGTGYRYASAALNGLGLAFVLVGASSMAAEVPERARGTSSAIFSAALLLGVALGSPLAGYLAERVPERPPYPSFLLPSMAAAAALAFSSIADHLIRAGARPRPGPSSPASPG